MWWMTLTWPGVMRYWLVVASQIVVATQELMKSCYTTYTVDLQPSCKEPGAHFFFKQTTKSYLLTYELCEQSYSRPQMHKCSLMKQFCACTITQTRHKCAQKLLLMKREQLRSPSLSCRQAGNIESTAEAWTQLLHRRAATTKPGGCCFRLCFYPLVANHKMNLEQNNNTG